MSTDARRAASSDDGGRARWPGPRTLALIGTAVMVAIAAVVVVLSLGSSSGHGGTIAIDGKKLPTTTKYGHTPAWLKIPKPPTTTTPVATAKAPQLTAMEGYPVLARLGDGSVLIAAEGPAVPGWVANEAASGHWKLGETAPSTFYVTFDHASGTVPVAAGDFTVITYTGKLLQPRVTDAGGGRLPTHVAPGQTLKLKLTTSLPEGDGEIRWSPDGKRILVAYAWTLEFD